MEPQISLNLYTEDLAQHLGSLELTDHSEFPLAISWSTGDFTDVTKRSGSYTKTFRVPASKLNNRILQYIYEIGINFYDSRPVCKGEVLYNGIPFFSGRLKINGVSQGLQPQEYDLELVGENLDWVEYMKNHSIRDIDYGNRQGTFFNNEWEEPLNIPPQVIPATTKQHTYNENYVLASWQNFPDKFDFLYGLKSYGAWQNNNRVVVEDLKPDVSIRHILLQSFRKAGYTVESNFFSTDFFKRLVLAFTGNNFSRSSGSNDYMLFKSVLCTAKPFEGYDSDESYGPNLLRLPDCTGHFDNGHNFGNHQYTVPANSRQRFVVEAEIRMNNWYENLRYFGIGIGKKNGNIITPIKEEPVDFTSNSITQLVTVDTDYLTFSQGEKLCVYTVVKTHKWRFPNINKHSPRFKIEQLSFSNEVATTIVEGTEYEVSQVLPEIKQIDVLAGTMNMFNLYFRTDINTKKVFCEPRDQFLKPISQALDWTEKFDAGHSTEIQYLDSYKRDLTFKYKLDSKDAFIKQLAETSKKHPGSLSHTLPPKYDPGNQELGAKEFAYTLTFQDWTIFNNQNPSNIAPVIPRLWKDLTPQPEASYEFAPRIMYYEGFKINYLPNSSGQLKASAWTFGKQHNFARYKYPLLTATLLQYGTNNGLVNNYYRNTLMQIEDGRQLIAWFNLDFTDILNLDLQRPIYINHPTLKGYYYITTLADYRPAKALPIKATLLPLLGNNNISIDLLDEADYSSSMKMAPTIGRGTGAADRFGNAVLGEDILTPSTVLNNGTGNWAPSGTASVAIGQGVIANARNQTVLGAYNVVSSSDIIQIGGGTSPTDRYRALTFTQDGNFLVQGGYLYTTDGREIMFASQRSGQGQPKRFDKLHLKGNE